MNEDLKLLVSTMTELVSSIKESNEINKKNAEKMDKIINSSDGLKLSEENTQEQLQDEPVIIKYRIIQKKPHKYINQGLHEIEYVKVPNKNSFNFDTEAQALEYLKTLKEDPKNTIDYSIIRVKV